MSRGHNVEQLLKHQQYIYHRLADAHQQWNMLRNRLDGMVKTFNTVMTTYAEAVAPSLEAMRQIDPTLKTGSSPLAPITLLQRRIEPTCVVPEEMLLVEEEETEENLPPSHQS